MMHMTDTAMQSITVVYDEHCVLCRRCRHWLELQRTHVPIEFLAAGSPAARSLYGDLPWLGEDLVVVSDSGDAWVGPAAFLMCLWATVEYRPWSYRLSGKTLSPLAERFFHMVSKQRGFIGRNINDVECDDGSCKHRTPSATAVRRRVQPAQPPSVSPVPHRGDGVPSVYVPPPSPWQPPSPRAEQP